MSIYFGIFEGDGYSLPTEFDSSIDCTKKRKEAPYGTSFLFLVEPMRTLSVSSKRAYGNSRHPDFHTRDSDYRHRLILGFVFGFEAKGFCSLQQCSFPKLSATVIKETSGTLASACFLMGNYLFDWCDSFVLIKNAVSYKNVVKFIICHSF